MAKFMKHEVIGKLFELGIGPLFYHGDIEVAKKIVRACVDGGAKVVEFTNRGDFAYQVFGELVKWCDKELPDAILGVGSVIDHATAALYINNGANFIVSPMLNPEIAKVCNRHGIPHFPGCGSLSEISEAEEMGCEIVKVFPSIPVGGPVFAKSVLAPCRWLKLMPTGGVRATQECISEWIKAGVAVLGMGSGLVKKDLVKAGDFEGISKLVEQCLWWVKEARGTPLFLGIDHIGLYPDDKVTGKAIADWYEKTFGFTVSEGRSAFHIPSRGPGEIEILKEKVYKKCHIAIRVSNFEEACKYLESKGIELEEPIIKKGVSKVVYLKNPDAAGNKIHLIFRY